jgi:phage baseplate assembly protein gpV
MTSIVETIQKIVQNELRTIRVAELGVVEAVSPHSDAGDHDNYGCDVRLKNTGLLLKRVPVATGHIGSAAIPNVGDLVLLTFEKGDVNQGIVVGRLYTDDDRPPLNNTSELIMHLPLHADDNAAIKSAIRNISANTPPREIIMEMPPKITVRITDGTVRATAGNSQMTLDQPDGGAGTVTVFAGGTKITMNEDGDVMVQSVGNMTLSAGGSMTLQAAESITIQAGTSAEIDAGTSLSLQAAAEATLQAAASLTVQASTISIGGLTTFSPG